MFMWVKRVLRMTEAIQLSLIAPMQFLSTLAPPYVTLIQTQKNNLSHYVAFKVLITIL